MCGRTQWVHINIWSQKVHTAKYSFARYLCRHTAVGRARLGEPHASTLRVGPRWTAHTLPRPARNLSTLASLRTAPAPTAATRASPLPQQHPFFASAAACPFCPAITMPEPPGRGCGVFLGSLRAIATKSSFTLVAVFALVSMKKMPLSLAYDSASSGSTLRLDAKSDLLPASAITMFGLPCLCSSFTHCFPRWNVSLFVMSYTTIAAAAPR
mmetsp:Transcript_25639/g.85458  ORF Transcript_25639/g.85458 Transcript_25639/m.85458 type:complete len:212 (-) Transcript_25639:319-954(-)